MKAILVWGGSSSVGSSVIQLAKASGLVIATTASPANSDYVRSLGAAFVFDYHDSEAAVKDLIDSLSMWRLVGAYDAIGNESTVKSCAKVVHELGGGMVVSVGTAPEDLLSDVEVVRVSSSNIVTEEPEVAKAIYENFVADALMKGILKAKPDPLVIRTGLDKVQAGLDRQKQGVSAKKVIVRF